MCLLWIFFRAPTFTQALAFLGGLVPETGSDPWPVTQTLVVIACAALHAAERAIRTRLPQIRAALDTPWGAISEGAAFGALIALAIAAGGIGGEFIYFQF